MKPTNGRIVHYYPLFHDGKPRAAIITDVAEDDSVSLAYVAERATALGITPSSERRKCDKCEKPHDIFCACSRCEREPTPEERFYACEDHREVVATGHMRIRGYRVFWMRPSGWSAK